MCLQLRDDLAQLEPRLDRAVAAARQELGVEVGFGEPEVVESQHLRYRTHREAERIDVRDQVTAVGVNLDEPRDGALLGCGRIAQRRRARGTRRDGPCRQRPTRGPGASRQFFDQRAVGDVVRRRSECREIPAPLPGRPTRGSSGRPRTSLRRTRHCRRPTGSPSTLLLFQSSLPMFGTGRRPDPRLPSRKVGPVV